MSHQISFTLSRATAPLEASRRMTALGTMAGGSPSVMSTTPRPSPVTDLANLVIGTLGRLKHALGARITFELEVEPELPPVGVDARTIEDLLVTSAAALTRTGSDEPQVLTLGVGLRELDATALAANLSDRTLAPGSYVTLHLVVRRDFATRTAGGPGPDLRSILPTLEMHGAGLLLNTTADTVSVRLLFSPQQRTTNRAPGAATHWSAESRRVLLADDDEAVRLIASRVLQMLKFEVTVAVDGQDALRQFEQSDEPFRAIMLDIAMPNLDGVSTAQEIRKLCPEQPILFISGDASEEVAQRVPAGLAIGVIQKPFSAAGIKATLEQCVSNPA